MTKIFVSMYNFADHKNDPYIMPPFYEAFVNGLKDAGNDVLCFFEKSAKLFDEEIPKEVLEKIKAFDPDLFIFFNNTFWDITQYFDCPIIIYDVDTASFFKNKDKIRRSVDRYHFLTFQDEAPALIQDVCGAQANQIRKVPLFTGVKADPAAEQTTNIAFVGCNWMSAGCNCIADFVQKEVSTEELEMARDVFHTFMTCPFKTAREIYEEKGYEVQNKLIINDLINSSNEIAGVLRARYLTAVADLGLDIRGYISWSNDTMKYFPELCLCYNKTQVFSLLENQRFYNHSKIGFNTNHIQAQSGFSWRVCDIMASNACLVSEYKPGLTKTFPGIPLPTFTSPAEAREQCLKILKEDNLRRDIVAASHEAINTRNRFKNVLKEIEDFLNMPLHTDRTGSLELFFFRKAKMTLKNKIGYKIWKHLKKKLSKKGLIQENAHA